MSRLILKICSTASSIDNGRNADDILDYALTELGELAEEIVIANGRSYKPAGKDGVSGEAIDLTLCLVDLLLATDPEHMQRDALLPVVDMAFSEEAEQKPRQILRQILAHLGRAAMEIEKHGKASADLWQAVRASLQIVRCEIPTVDEDMLIDMTEPKLNKWASAHAAFAHA